MFKVRIFYFVIFLIIIYMSVKKAEGFVPGKFDYTVNMFDKVRGADAIREEVDNTNYNKREIEARSKFTIKNQDVKTMRKEYMEMYIKSTKDFKDQEKENVVGAIKSLFSRFKDQVPLIRAWNIIKVDNEVDWGYPHTFGNHIVIQEKHLGDMDSLAELLFHEQLHIIQRKNKSIFSEFYQKHWGFIPYELPDDEWINKYLVHNPDSNNEYYIYRLTDQIYMLPLPVTYNDHYELMEYGMFLTNEKKILAKGDEPHVEPLRYIAKYNERFYRVPSLYHPNEIFATVLSGMVFRDLSITEKDSTGLNALFKQLNLYF